ncbi:MAG: hypothetical protein KDC38_14655, partial [Planctomycetes bacterium]|nr:hypothetical protein [Planctomycetota bacterium]
RLALGASWFRERVGCSLLSVEGDPFTLGYANARLTGHLFAEQERSLIETVREHFPSTLSFWAIATLVLINNRSLPDYVLPAHQEEIFGLASGSEDHYPELGPRYHRILNYHAAHDISHWVWDQPVVGCTAFAATGPQTSDGHLIIGRNFDFEAGRHFDENKIIGLYRPAKGHAFLSVSWPGMAGAVTGLNDDRIFCSINGAHSEDRDNIGTPVSLVVREVLQYADSIEAAVAIIESAPVFVSDSYLVADGRAGTAVVIEKSPGKCAVRPMENGVILQANHFETDAFAQDRGNLDYQREGTSLARHARLSELVARARGHIDPDLAVEILRDRRAVGDQPLGLGHRSAINALIATHSAVADVTDGVLWVSRGPYPLGAFEPYTIESFGHEHAATIAADPLLDGDTVRRLTERRALLNTIESELDDSVLPSPEHITALDAAIHDDVLDWRASYLRARTADALHDATTAREFYGCARDASPPFHRDRTAIDAALRRLGSNPKPSIADGRDENGASR